jgi:alkylhydroperoxidase family enzyme
MTDDIGWDSLPPGAVPLALADAVAGFGGALAVLGTAADPNLLELVRRRVATLLQVPLGLIRPVSTVGAAQAAALPHWPTASMFTDRERFCLGFAEQFVIDVAGIGAADRDELVDMLGGAGFGFVQAIYVLDHGFRLAVMLRQLFGGVMTTADVPAIALWPALERMMSAVATLSGLDPLTAELVRLRGARFHHCRVCTSRRRSSAVTANPMVLEATDVLDQPGLTATQRAAIQLADVMLLRPAAIPPEVMAAVHEDLTPRQAGEVVLLVAHNAANKIAVALGADEPTVSEGVEYFDIAPTGEYSYGLPSPP